MTGYTVDLHVKVLDEPAVEYARRRGIDAVVYAPHFVPLPEIERRAAQLSTDGVAVLPAREIFTGGWGNRRHLLALDLSAPIPDYISFEGAIAELRRQDAIVLAPHPSFLSISLERADIEATRSVLAGIEVYNTKHLAKHNRDARRLATDFDIPVFGSSYAHLPKTIGEAWTTFDSDVGDPATLLAALRSGSDRVVGHRTGLSHRSRRWLEFGHIFWENSVQKIQYSLTNGRQTLPDNPIYEGRFDDISVY